MRALDLFDLGLSLFPCEPRSKQPATSYLPRRWDEVREKSVPTWKPFQTERATREQIATWFGPLNPALVTGSISGVSVVDPDSPEALAWCERLPRTPFVVKTARGLHFYFRYAPGLPAFIYPDDTLRIEIKSDGRYVMAPGAIHPSGSVYEVVGGRLPANLDELPPFPLDRLVDLRTVKPSSASGDGYEFPEEVFAGERHHELFKLVRSFKGLGADLETCREAVRRANENRCKPPLTDREFDPRGGFDTWTRRVFNQPDRPLDPLGDRIPIRVDVQTSGWL